MRYLLLFLFTITTYIVSEAQNALDNALVGYSIVDVKSNSVIAEKNGYMALVPASVTKVITTATVVDVIPPQKRFETSVEYKGYISNGTLFGKLIIKGCGDPSLASTHMNSSKERVFGEIVSILNRNGISRVCGEIICDDSLFPFNDARGAWLAEDLGNYFAAESYGFNFIDNQYSLYFNTCAEGSKATITDCDPAMPELEFINRLYVKGNGKDSAYITGMDFSKTRLLNGRIPCNQTGYVLKGSIPSPADVFKREFRSYLIKNGLWSEATKPINSNNRQHSLGVIYSPQLQEIVKVTNFKSNNLYAETLLKWCGLVRGGGATTERGINVINTIWTDKGVDMSNCTLFDGSGLSPKNRISPNCLSKILCMAVNNKAFRNSLPKVSVEGTVKNFMKESSIAKYLTLKSGSMQGVQCYAGYYDDGNKCYAIVIMVNNFKGKRRDVQTEIGNIIEGLIKQ